VGRVASLCGNVHRNTMPLAALKRFYLGQKSRFETVAWDAFENHGAINIDC